MAESTITFVEVGISTFGTLLKDVTFFFESLDDKKNNSYDIVLNIFLESFKNN